MEYWWESHLDASRPEGVSFYLPAPELIRLMGLKPPSARSPHVIKDNSGRNVIVHHTGDEKSFSVSIRKDAFEQFLFEQELGCLWFVFGERSAWPTGGHESLPGGGLETLFVSTALKRKALTGKHLGDAVRQKPLTRYNSYW